MEPTGASRRTLRPGRPEDATAVVGLWKAAGAEPTVTDDPDSIQALLRHDPEAVVVVEVDGEVVGAAIAGWDGWRGNLYRLAVHPSYRRQGLGRALVAEAERRLSACGARRVNALVVRADGQATTFWEAAGYPFDDHMHRHVKTL